MCGIVGQINSSSNPRYLSTGEIQNVLRSIAHRGPDDQGYVTWRGHDRKENQAIENYSILLGHTRLSILDLSSDGHQPIFSRDNNYSLVFNGEIYNYIELREELQELGHQFTSSGDSEVLLYALIEWGESALHKLEGMYAFALYNSLTKSVLCARDPFGIKPFYYHIGREGFTFASETQSLLKFPYISSKASALSARSFLCNGHYDIKDGTFFSNIKQLQAGSLVNIKLAAPCHVSPQIWWTPKIDTSTPALSFDEASEYLRDLFLKSVRLHLRSDVPLGVALSGGIDSSAIACAVRKLEPDADIHTFSYIPDDSKLSEQQWIDLIASHIKSKPHFTYASNDNLVDDLSILIRAQGEPFGTTSIYAQFKVFELAKAQGIKVTLDGQGADELFAGYLGYPAQRIQTLLNEASPKKAYLFLINIIERHPADKRKIILNSLKEFLPPNFSSMALSLVGKEQSPGWLDLPATLKNFSSGFTWEDSRSHLTENAERVKTTLAYQISHHGLPQLLRHADRNSMFFSIESRVPFLNKEIAEFCLSLPEEYLISQSGESKSVLRHALKDLVPREILERKDKIGFTTPQYDWVKTFTNSIENLLHNGVEAPFINRHELLRYLKRNQKLDHSLLWRLLNYLEWCKEFKVSHES